MASLLWFEWNWKLAFVGYDLYNEQILISLQFIHPKNSSVLLNEELPLLTEFIQSACLLTTAITLSRVKFRIINDKLSPNNLAVNVSVCKRGSSNTICNQSGFSIITATSWNIFNPHNNLSVNSDNRWHCNISNIRLLGRQLFSLDL